MNVNLICWLISFLIPFNCFFAPLLQQSNAEKREENGDLYQGKNKFAVETTADYEDNKSLIASDLPRTHQTILSGKKNLSSHDESDEKEVRHSELGAVDRRFTESMGALSIGGDLVLRFGLSEHIGIFASVGGRWLPITVTESSVRYEKDDDYVRTETYIDDDRGVYSVVPAIGAMWKF